MRRATFIPQVDHQDRRGVNRAGSGATWMPPASLVCLASGLLVSFVAGGARAAGVGPCSAMTEAHVEVRVEERRLYLCAPTGIVKQTYSVRLARNGAGKRRAGDGKLPLGTYPLGKPRASRQYGTFIPIGYPTEEQRRQAYTGGDVGVHGPARRVRWLGRLVNTFDTTEGCVGVATDQEMAEIAAWVRRTKAARIVVVQGAP